MAHREKRPKIPVVSTVIFGSISDTVGPDEYTPYNNEPPDTVGDIVENV